MKNNWHPLQINFCGYSGSGKTTLIEKLVQVGSSQFDIGYIKHDAHKFKMDYPGKDTHRIWEKGAKYVGINDKEHHGQIWKNDFHLSGTKSDCFPELDFLFVEGYKKDPGKKIILLDDDGKILKELLDNKYENVLAVCGKEKNLNIPFPYFERNSIDSLVTFLLEYFKSTQPKKINGLVLAGGKSTRMGEDKAFLNYYGKSQLERISDLLTPFCEDVYHSINSSQLEKMELFDSFNQLPDRFIDFGPLGGILTAFCKDPHNPWLIVACDLPYLSEDSIKHLVDQRNPYFMATSYVSEEHNLPEPLCAIYEPKIHKKLMSSLQSGTYCPRKILIQSKIKKVVPNDFKSLMNVNHKKEFEDVQIDLKSILKNRRIF